MTEATPEAAGSALEFAEPAPQPGPQIPRNTPPVDLTVAAEEPTFVGEVLQTSALVGLAMGAAAVLAGMFDHGRWMYGPMPLATATLFVPFALLGTARAPGWGWRGRAIASLLIAGLIGTWGLWWAPPMVVGLALAATLRWAWSSPLVDKLLVFVTATLAAIPAVFVGNVWLSAADRYGVPLAVGFATTGAAVGLCLGLGESGRRARRWLGDAGFGRGLDRVERAFTAVLDGPDAGSPLSLVLKPVLATYRAVRPELPRQSKVGLDRRRLRALATRILDIAQRALRVERDLKSARVAELPARIAQLTARIEATDDPVARASLADARATLESQQRATAQVGRALDRIAARLEAHGALLERVAFGYVFARSVDAERLGEEPLPALRTLEELSGELDATSAAVGEVYGQLDR